MNLGWMLLMCGLLIAPPPKPIKVPGIGKPPKSDDLAVDIVQIGSGPKLLGAVLRQSPRGDLVVAVERSWLERAYPEFYAKQSVSEAQEARGAWRELTQRLGEWRKRRAGEDRLRSFIEMEQARVDKNLARLKPESARLDDQFMIIDVRARQVELMQLKPADRRQIAMLAWREQLPDVATKSVSSLSKELADLGFSVADERVNLFDRLPIRRQSDKEWQARRALLEYVERQSLDYQGTTDLLVGTGAGQEPPDLGAVISPGRAVSTDVDTGGIAGWHRRAGRNPGKAQGGGVSQGVGKSAAGGGRQENRRVSRDNADAGSRTSSGGRRRAVFGPTGWRGLGHGLERPGSPGRRQGRSGTA
ncbi:MAG: hypothetical protein NT069_30525 [Planctomycetota bacterium]|nr:hypothetical protein [Planctomycetota bacterium]